MTNKEKFKEEILELACKGERIAVDRRTNKPYSCSETHCIDCALNCAEMTHGNALYKWGNEEYVEPCPFEEGELVEVSDDKKYWYLEYFVKFTGKYETREYKEDKMTHKWVYCQKYGTLGGLVKGEQ